MAILDITRPVALNWNSVVEGATAGIVASLILGLFALSRDVVRNVVLKVKLKFAFRRLSVGNNLEGVTVGVSNHIGRPFTVRQLAMLTDIGHYQLNPIAEVTSSFEGQYPKITRQQRRALRRGEEIPVSTEFQFRKWKTNPTSEGFIIVQPFTSQKFLLPAQLIANLEGTISGLRITLEYESWTKSIHVMQVTTHGTLDLIRKTVERFKSQISSGSLNATRAALGKAPVIPRTPEGATHDAKHVSTQDASENTTESKKGPKTS